MIMKISIKPWRAHGLIMLYVSELCTWHSSLAVVLQGKQTDGMCEKCIAKTYGILLRCFGAVMFLQNVICLREKARLC